jgi:hypothetical protein
MSLATFSNRIETSQHTLQAQSEHLKRTTRGVTACGLLPWLLCVASIKLKLAAQRVRPCRFELQGSWMLSDFAGNCAKVNIPQGQRQATPGEAVYKLSILRGPNGTPALS